VYDDRALALDPDFRLPPMPGDGSGGDTNSPPPQGGGVPLNIGTNLFLLIGPTNNNQAWLTLTNTHSPTYYQIQSRADVNPGTPWQFGQILQCTDGNNQLGFSNVPVNRFLHRTLV
jgi:hypothetical protein